MAGTYRRKIVLSLLLLLGAVQAARAAENGVGYIEVTSNVNHALVMVDGKGVGFTPYRGEVPVGTWFTVEIWSDGYVKDTHKDCMIFQAGSTLKIHSTLQRTPTTGSISVRANVSGASVYLDGTYKGTAPLVIRDVQPGSHTVRVTKQNYKDAVHTVQVTAGNEHTVSASLQATQIEVKVTNVSGVSIYLDGMYKGTAPLVIQDISPGRHVLRASKGKFDDETIIFTIAAGESKVATFTMKTAGLDVSANVAGATVYLDGTKKGTTPLSMRDLEPGEHTIRVTRTHYAPQTVTVTLTGGYILSQTLTLEKISGYLTVQATPQDAELSVNGTAVQKSDYEIDEGTYTIRLRAFGYEDITDTVTVTRNQTTTVRKDMQPAPFRITSFTAREQSLNPRNKNVHNTITFAWGINGPEQGAIVITDSSRRTRGSIPVQLTTWSGTVTWAGSFGGTALDDGTYTATLRGGDQSRSVTFTVDSTIKDYDQKSRASGIYFDAGGMIGSFYGGFDFGISGYFGGNHLYGGVGMRMSFPNVSDGYREQTSVQSLFLCDFSAMLGLSFNFYRLRPYAEAGAGFYLCTVSPSDASLDGKAGGLSLNLAAGCDITSGRLSVGGFYRLRYLSGLGWSHGFGATIGIAFK